MAFLYKNLSYYKHIKVFVHNKFSEKARNSIAKSFSLWASKHPEYVKKFGHIEIGNYTGLV